MLFRLEQFTAAVVHVLHHRLSLQHAAMQPVLRMMVQTWLWFDHLCVRPAGLLYDPPGRNWKAYMNRQTDWAHQLNGGGKKLLYHLVGL
jgi:hypothetical protein